MVKNPTANEGDMGSILGFGRSPGKGNGYPLQYSCLENPMDRGARWATVHSITKSQNIYKYSMLHFSLSIFPDRPNGEVIPFTSVSSNKHEILKDKIGTG